MRLPKTIRKSSFSGSSSLAGFAGLLLAALLVCFEGPSSSQADSVPDWLSAAGRADRGHFGDGSAAVVLGQWTEFTVDATGKFIMTERRAMRILNRRAAEPYLGITGTENTNQKVTSIQTWAIAPSGRVTQSGKKDIKTVAGYTAFEEFTDIREKGIETPGAEDGSLVGSEVVTQGRILVGGERFRMEDELPVLQAELHVSVPSGSFHWFLNHPDRVKVISQTSTSAVFQAENRPAIPDESYAPPFSSVAAVVFINYDPKGPARISRSI